MPEPDADDLTQPLTRLAARRQAERETVREAVREAAQPGMRRPAAPAPVLSPAAPGRAGLSGGPPSRPPARTAGVGAGVGGAQAATRRARRQPRREGGALATASTVMAAGTALSRALGFVRVAVLAAVIGVNTMGGNTFAVANTIPNNLYLLIAGGVLNAVLVPQVVRAMRREDGGEDYLNRLVTAAVLALVVVTGLLVVASPLIIWVAGHSLRPRQHDLAVAFAMWCLPQVFFYAMYTLLGQILNARGRFGAYMWAPVVNNVVAIAGIVVFALAFGRHPTGDIDWTGWPVAVLAGTSTLGVVAQAAVLIGPLRRSGVRLRPRFGLRGVGLGSAGRSTVWVIAGLLVGNVAFLVTTNVSTYASPGEHDPLVPGAAAWGYAYLLFMLPHSLVAVSLVTALFTRMSEAATRQDVRAVRADVSSGLRTIAVASVLSAAGLLVLARPAAVLLTGDVPGSRNLALVIVAMAVGMVPFSANYLLQRAFYAFEDARTPFLAQVVSVAVWSSGALLSAAFLNREHIVAGAAAAMSLGQLCSVAVSLRRLQRRLRGIDAFRVVRTHARLVVAAVLACGAGVAVAHPLAFLIVGGRVGAGIVAVAAGTAMLAVYAVCLVVMRVEEVRPLARRLARPLARRLAAR